MHVCISIWYTDPPLAVWGSPPEAGYRKKSFGPRLQSCGILCGGGDRIGTISQRELLER